VQIYVSSGTGSGPTMLAAFDAALIAAGIGNSNLLPLSSAIPARSTVVRRSAPGNQADWGKRLYVVLAEQRESELGLEAWAGLGWAQDPEGRGLFVEHFGGSRQVVERLIESSLTAMTQSRQVKLGTIECEIAGVTCRSEPVCAVVAARYLVDPW
jgi:arginine decarboxylase